MISRIQIRSVEEEVKPPIPTSHANELWTLLIVSGVIFHQVTPGVCF